MIFGSWHFKIDNSLESKVMRKSIYSTIFTEIHVDEIKKKIEARTKKQWRILYAKRFFLMTLNVIFLLGSCFAIIYVNMNHREIEVAIHEFVEHRNWITSDLKRSDRPIFKIYSYIYYFYM